MKKISTQRTLTLTIIAAGIFLLGASRAHGEILTRTWVSANGDDSQPCSRQKPCRSFAGAIAKTAAGGEILALNSGGYGKVLITKSITIDGAGVYAAISDVFDGGSDASIGIDASKDSRVVLRGLTLHRMGPAPLEGFTSGIDVGSVGELFVEDCTITNYDNGIFTPGGLGILIVKDTLFRRSGTAVNIAGVSRATFEHCQLEKNSLSGFQLISTDSIISNCLLSGNTVSVMALDGTNVTVERSVIEDSDIGIEVNHVAQGSNAVVHVSETMFAINGQGIDPGNGQIISFGNNRFSHNSNDGAFTSTKSLQ